MNGSQRRAAAMIVFALTLLTGGFVVTTAVAGAATTGCRASYEVTSEWPGGFVASVTVTNLGDPVDGWTLTWDFATGQAVSHAWNATTTQSGTAVTAQHMSYNGTLATNASTSFGFIGSWETTNAAPTTFALNGAPCTGTPTASPCASPSIDSPSPTTSPSPSPSSSSDSPSPSPSSSPSDSPSDSPSPSSSTSPSSPSPSPSAPQDKVTIWLAGDSTMANGSSSGACPIGWGKEFASNFNSNVTVVNRAVGGRSVQTWLYEPYVTTTKDDAGECIVSEATLNARWQAMLNSSTGMKAGDYLFIQFGINDGDSRCARHVGSARYKELLSMMARAAQERGARPVYLTPVAAITCTGSTATGNRGFLTETFDAGVADNVPVIDLHTLSYNLYNTLGLCPNDGDYSQGAVGEFFCADHTHFDTPGARQIANVVATAVRNQQLDLAAYLK